MCQLAALYTAWHWYIGTLANYSYLYGNEDYDPIFSMEEVSIDGMLPLPGVVLYLSQKGTFLSPVSSLVLHVHVSLLYMYMFHCLTCTCFTALHVHVKQRYTPRLHTLLYEIELYQYRRKRRMAMTNTIKFKTESIYD